MQQHAENDAGHPTEAAEEPEDLYGEVDDELDGAYDDGDAEPSGHEEVHEATLVPDGDVPARAGTPSPERGPDVFLDVPQLKVDEIDLDVENLRARVSLQAEVLDLLKLNVGADVALGQVHLGITGVEAQAQLKVRLDNVALIINRVLTTLDRNPQILEDLARGIGSAVQDVGRGTGSAVDEVGQGAGSAVRDVGQGAGSAAEAVGGNLGEAVGDVGRGVGDAMEEVGGAAGAAAGEVGGAIGSATTGAGDAARETGRAAGHNVRRTARTTGTEETTGTAGKTGTRGAAEKATRRAGASRTPPSGRTAARPSAGRTGHHAEEGRPSSATRRRRKRDDESQAARSPARRGTRNRDEPP